MTESLRGRVEALLCSHDEAGSFLQGVAAAGVEHTLDQPIAERPGTQIGPYKLIQEIGEGGFGVVYLAEQQQPMRRQVALKIIKPGMDTREVIARFETEREALALMDHPNIAHVFDAGATESGRPYFVMELVHGVPITDYCDQHELTIRERLELFVDRLPGRPTCPSQGDHPSRPQAVQRAGRRKRGRTGSEGHRFRRRQGHGSSDSRNGRRSPAWVSW